MGKKDSNHQIIYRGQVLERFTLAAGSSFNAQRSVAEVFGWAAPMKTASGLSWNSPFRYMTAWSF